MLLLTFVGGWLSGLFGISGAVVTVPLLLYGPQTTRIPLPYGPELWKGLPKGVSLSIDPDPLQF